MIFHHLAFWPASSRRPKPLGRFSICFAPAWTTTLGNVWGNHGGCETYTACAAASANALLPLHATAGARRPRPSTLTWATVSPSPLVLRLGRCQHLLHLLGTAGLRLDMHWTDNDHDSVLGGPEETLKLLEPSYTSRCRLTSRGSCISDIMY